ncbi:MAG: PfkB family carbohydrate kinase [Thiolinea sp.]
MSLLLLVGNATLDIINEVTHYPAEDEELRAVAQTVSSGGNAANSARILAQAGHRCDFVGVLAAGWCRRANPPEPGAGRGAPGTGGVQATGCSPVSHIILNQANGSRTIIHHRDLPELSLTTLQALAWSRYDWLHFEGRNVEVLNRFLQDINRQGRFDQTLSLEIEKRRPGVEQLMEWVDVVMFSQAYARALGHADAASLLQQQHQRYPEHSFTCTWGAEGAWAMDRLGELWHQPAMPVAEVQDTLGAGDVFNAGLIHAMSSGQPLQEALAFAVQLAGAKVSRKGLTGWLAGLV